jgi:hypothetical protein
MNDIRITLEFKIPPKDSPDEWQTKTQIENQIRGLFEDPNYGLVTSVDVLNIQLIEKPTSWEVEEQPTPRRARNG